MLENIDATCSTKYFSYWFCDDVLGVKMELKEFKNRNISDEYVIVQEDNYPKTSWEIFKQVLSRSVKGELFVGMKITFGIMYRALFKGEMATVQYPKEKLPIGHVR